MKYTYKERVRMARKLKIFLAVFFAAITFFTGKVLLDKTFAADNGTATITYNAGSDGMFQGGLSTNTVTYNLVKRTFKYSHTPNLSDDGEKLSNFSENRDIIDVITIPGATSLHIKLTFGLGINDSINLWKGSNPTGSYFGSNIEQIDYINYPNSNHFYTSNTVEYDCSGDTVTIGFDSYSTVHGDGYGYYAIIYAETDDGVLSLGSIANGEYKEPIGNGDLSFASWDKELLKVGASTTINATYGGLVGSGTYDGVSWKVKRNGELLLGQANTTQTFTYLATRQQYNYDWYTYHEHISSVKFLGTVNGNGSMSYMFAGLSYAKSIDLTNFTTNNVTDLSYLFYACRKVTALNLNGFNTSNVTSMEGMLYYCENLESLNIANLNTTNVTNMSYMFASCRKLGSITFGNNFNTSKVTTMSYMFSACTNLLSLNVSMFNTSLVTDISYMFSSCYSLVTLNLSSFNTSNVTTMSSMFESSNNLENVVLTSFNTTNVTDMGYMFRYCGSLQSLDLSSFYTPNLTKTAYLFAYCENLISIDMSNFDMRNLDTHYSSYDEFSGCTSLNTLKLGPYFRITGRSNLDGTWKKQGEEELILLSRYNFENLLGTERMGTYVKFDKKIANLYSDGCLKFENHNTEDGVIKTYAFYEEGVFSSPNDVPWKDDVESIEAVLILTPLAPVSMAYWFYGMKNLKDVNFGLGWEEGLYIRLDTSNVIDMHSMFEGCESLKYLDFSGIITNNVIDMSHMFANCINLQSIKFFSCDDSGGSGPMKYEKSPKVRRLNDEEDIKAFITSNVEDMSYMFYNCKSLVQLNLSAEITMEDPGLGPMSYKTMKISDGQCLDNSNMFDTSSVITMEKMFAGCEKLMRLDISEFNTINTTNMNNMFLNTVRLKQINLGSEFSFVTPTGLAKSWTYVGTNTTYTASQLEAMYDGDTMAGVYNSTDSSFAILYTNGDLVFQSGNVPDPTRGSVVEIFQDFEYSSYSSTGSSYDPVMGWYDHAMTPWGSYCFQITRVIFETEIVPISIANWFYRMENLTEIENIELLDTTYVIDMSKTFYNCSSIDTIDVSNFSTSRVTGMNAMFYGCESLETLDLSNFDTISVTNMSYMFYNCSGLIALDLTSFLTDNLEYLDSMFSDCSSLLSLDLSNFDTTNVDTFNNVFDGCSSLLNLDIRNFQISGPSSYYMLYNTPELRVLTLGRYTNLYYNSAYDNSGLQNSWQRDGDDTIYRAETLMNNYDGTTMAGTYRRTTPPIPHIMIYSNGDMVFQLGDSVDSSRGNLLASYTDFEGGIYSLSYDIPWTSFTNNITRVVFLDEMYPVSTANWFVSMYNLTTIVNIEYLNTANVENMSSMFAGCESLESLDLTSFNTSRVMDMSYMFYNCYDLEALDLSSFDTRSVTTMDEMFAGCESLISLDVTGFETFDLESMNFMFAGCSSISSLDLSSFNTDYILDEVEPRTYYRMENFLDDMNDLRLLTLGKDFEFKASSGLTGSWQSDNDDSVYTASQLEQSYNGATMAGVYRAVVQLTITEQVKGGMADINKNFDFTITALRNGNGLNSNQAYSGTRSGNIKFNNGSAVFALKHGETIIINLPSGVDYTITQSNGNYTLAKTNDSGILNDNIISSFIDTLNSSTVTGLFLSLIPYILMLIFSIGGIIMIKRFNQI